MFAKLLIAFLLTFYERGFVQGAGAGDIPWGYNRPGTIPPPLWGAVALTCGTGHFQSPIDIDYVTYDPTLKDVTLENYDKPADRMTMINNQHTAQVSVEADRPIIMRSATMPFPSYQLAQLHFHWGCTDVQGAEHTLHQAKFPIEVHFVHYTTAAKSLADALTIKHGVAVIGYFFEISKEDNPVLDDLISKLTQVKFAGEAGVALTPFAFSDLLGTSVVDNYYRYIGSLTTPPCVESIVWTVVEKPLKISSAQLNAFRMLYEARPGEEHAEPLRDNFRPPQPLQGRTIYSSFLEGA